jgi:hypothetical protein
MQTKQLEIWDEGQILCINHPVFKVLKCHSHGHVSDSIINFQLVILRSFNNGILEFLNF